MIGISVLWAKLSIPIGILNARTIPKHMLDLFPLRWWQLYLFSWVIGLTGVLVAGREGWLWFKKKMRFWRKEREEKAGGE